MGCDQKGQAVSQLLDGLETSLLVRQKTTSEEGTDNQVRQALLNFNTQ